MLTESNGAPPAVHSGRRYAPPPVVRFAWFLRAADVGIFLVAHHALLWCRGAQDVHQDRWTILGIIVALLAGAIWLMDGWRIDPREPAWRLPVRFAAGVALASVLIGLAVYLVGPEVLGEAYGVAGRIVLAGSMGFTLLAGILSRWWVVRRCKRFSSSARWLLLSGADDELASRLAADVEREPSLGAVDILRPAIDQGLAIDGHWTGVVVHGHLPHQALLAVMHARLGGAPVLDLPDFYERYCYRVPVVALDHRWFAVSDGFDLLHSSWYRHLKRIGDVLLAGGLILSLSWLMLVAALAVKMTSRGPVLYRQIRTGLGGRTFSIAKFRSMRVDAEAGGAKWAIKDDPRVTAVGRFLRRSRIDELPQLWNVLVGEMSMIGPRPERPEFNATLEAQIPWYDLRHLVKPGLTGWAQVNYPYGASVEDALRKLEYDLYYIKNQSLVLDMVIVVRTVRVVMRGFGSR